jgi:hypothetical protein
MIINATGWHRQGALLYVYKSEKGAWLKEEIRPEVTLEK